MSIENSDDTIGNRTRDLPACSRDFYNSPRRWINQNCVKLCCRLCVCHLCKTQLCCRLCVCHLCKTQLCCRLCVCVTCARHIVLPVVCVSPVQDTIVLPVVCVSPVQDTFAPTEYFAALFHFPLRAKLMLVRR